MYGRVCWRLISSDPLGLIGSKVRIVYGKERQSRYISPYTVPHDGQLYKGVVCKRASVHGIEQTYPISFVFVFLHSDLLTPVAMASNITTDPLEAAVAAVVNADRGQHIMPLHIR